MALRMPGEGLVTVSLRRSMVLDDMIDGKWAMGMEDTQLGRETGW